MSVTRRWRLPFRSFRGGAFSSKLAPLMVQRLKPLAAVDLPENYNDPHAVLAVIIHCWWPGNASWMFSVALALGSRTRRMARDKNGETF
jgi:hypothetical protein